VTFCAGCIRRGKAQASANKKYGQPSLKNAIKNLQGRTMLARAKRVQGFQSNLSAPLVLQHGRDDVRGPSWIFT
jgi:hypothetical protein